MKYIALILVALLPLVACQSGPSESPDPKPRSASSSGQGTTRGPTHGAERPRFSPDGRMIAYHAGKAGQRQIHVMNVDGSEARALTSLAGDNRDPTWGPDGARIVFASNRGGDYDLYAVNLVGGELEQITNFEGDELEPTVSSVRYAFYAVRSDGCSRSGADGVQVDGYEKVVFTRRHDSPVREEVWFASMTPLNVASVKASWRELDQLSQHNVHNGRLSPPDASCREPAFSGDGLSLLWSCEPGKMTINDNLASWEQSFEGALAAVGQLGSACSLDDWEGESFMTDPCIAKLARRYSAYAGPARSSATDGVERAGASANQIVLVGDVDGKLVHRERMADRAEWIAFDIAADDARNVVWSPDGKRVAFDADGEQGREIVVAEVDFYLQEVRNLHTFAELHGAGQSAKLHANRFVARPGQEKEFYALYEKLRYQRRAQFITADAALQAFRDEFVEILQSAEERAAEDLRTLSKALFEYFAIQYAESGAPQHRYLALYFATAWVPLEAAATMKMLSADDYLTYSYSRFNDDEDDEDDEELAQFNRLRGPPIERLPAEARRVLAAEIPEGFRAEVGARLDSMFAHAAVGDLIVPSRAKPARIDWTQFKVRGNYAENTLGGYFLAMVWYAQAPLPFDASLHDVVVAMRHARVGAGSALETWTRIDAVVSTFMGKPVDATIGQLVQLSIDEPALLRPFDAKAMASRLEALRGPIMLRDAEAAESGSGELALKITLFPKRVGLDSTFFRGLTHPNVEMRGMPSALDVMGVLAGEHARELALEQLDLEDGQISAANYREALDKLIAETPAMTSGGGYWNTDVYHSWLATLVVLAGASDVASDSLMSFTHSKAWQDRRIASALGSYTQLKHSAVLYNMQDMGVECDSDDSFYVMIEQPILPIPHGFVDPLPSFFDALAALADRVYKQLHDQPEGPHVPWWSGEENDPVLNARNFARDLAELARHELSGKPLNPKQLAWIEITGGRLEALTLGLQTDDTLLVMGSEARAQRGVALVTDVHTNLQRAQVLQLGIGRLLNLYVAVPDGIGQTMTQGGMFSFYEFVQPMSDRLTDEQWDERITGKQLPARPRWTASFVEEAAAKGL
ncbi:MAG: DUF3160 domain-containing protein [Bradymonadaceae bacterium]|nr:DUF3160 domain-containing protein [Lujinxingiaceae bacterium]